MSLAGSSRIDWLFFGSQDEQKSIWAVVADDALALLATSYRVVISVIGAWLTARLAPAKPMKHAMILGYVGVILGLIGLAVTWNARLGPRWYPIALVVLAIPQCWAGGKLYEMQLAKAQFAKS